MKKTTSAMIILFLFLIPALGSASYLIRLKNGGQLTTPAYWFEGKRIFFYIPGGTAGMERMEIDRIESYEVQDDRNTIMVYMGTGKKGLPPTSPPRQKPQEQTPASKAREEKIDLKAFKDTKDRMTVELNSLLGKQREAAARGDNEAKEKIMGELRNTSGQIYKLTDEVKKKNEGKLPDGWWGK